MVLFCARLSVYTFVSLASHYVVEVVVCDLRYTRLFWECLSVRLFFTISLLRYTRLFWECLSVCLFFTISLLRYTRLFWECLSVCLFFTISLIRLIKYLLNSSACLLLSWPFQGFKEGFESLLCSFFEYQHILSSQLNALPM